jgi:hypothetical protein
MSEPFTPDQPRDDGARTSGAKRAGTKRPYRRPQLIEYGSVAKLTQGTRTTQSDGGGGGGFKMSCL